MTLAMLGMLIGLALVRAGLLRRGHRPRLLQLVERVDAGPQREPISFARAVTLGLARVNGQCTVCGNTWTPDHGPEPHPRWVRRIPMPHPPGRRLD